MPAQEPTPAHFTQFFLDPTELEDDELCLFSTPLVAAFLKKSWIAFIQDKNLLDVSLIGMPVEWQFKADRRLVIEHFPVSDGRSSINFIFSNASDDDDFTPALFHEFVGTLGFFPYAVGSCGDILFATFQPEQWIQSWYMKDETFDCYMDFRAIAEAHEANSEILVTPSITFTEAEEGAVAYRVPKTGDEVVLHYSQLWEFEEFSYPIERLNPNPYSFFLANGLLDYKVDDFAYATYTLTE